MNTVTQDFSTRRNFIKSSSAVSLAGCLLPRFAFADERTPLFSKFAYDNQQYQFFHLKYFSDDSTELSVVAEFQKPIPSHPHLKNQLNSVRLEYSDAFFFTQENEYLNLDLCLIRQLSPIDNFHKIHVLEIFEKNLVAKASLNENEIIPHLSNTNLDQTIRFENNDALLTCSHPIFPQHEFNLLFGNENRVVLVGYNTENENFEVIDVLQNGFTYQNTLSLNLNVVSASEIYPSLLNSSRDMIYLIQKNKISFFELNENGFSFLNHLVQDEIISSNFGNFSLNLEKDKILSVFEYYTEKRESCVGLLLRSQNNSLYLLTLDKESKNWKIESTLHLNDSISSWVYSDGTTFHGVARCHHNLNPSPPVFVFKNLNEGFYFISYENSQWNLVYLLKRDSYMNHNYIVSEIDMVKPHNLSKKDFKNIPVEFFSDHSQESKYGFFITNNKDSTFYLTIDLNLTNLQWNDSATTLLKNSFSSVDIQPILKNDDTFADDRIFHVNLVSPPDNPFINDLGNTYNDGKIKGEEIGLQSKMENTDQNANVWSHLALQTGKSVEYATGVRDGFKETAPKSDEKDSDSGVTGMDFLNSPFLFLGGGAVFAGMGGFKKTMEIADTYLKEKKKLIAEVAEGAETLSENIAETAEIAGAAARKIVSAQIGMLDRIWVTFGNAMTVAGVVLLIYGIVHLMKKKGT